MTASTLHVHADLAFFVDPGDTGVAVPVHDSRSVKDAIESVGIPHPEVDIVLVNGRSVGFDHLVRGGERIDVFPAGADMAVKSHMAHVCHMSYVRPPMPPPRFACDVHLGRLARRLRLLGLDTWYASHADDAELADLAVDQDRILLTRDRGLMMRRIIVHAYCPRSDNPDEQTVEVLRRFALDEELAPMTRCARCNGPLEATTKEAVIDDLPPRTRLDHEKFSRCTDCGQVYWPGSHVKHITSFVRATQSAARQDAVNQPEAQVRPQ